MALPNFYQVTEVNSLLKEIQELEAAISTKKSELNNEEKKVERDVEKFKQGYLANLKQRMILEQIESEIKNLKVKEKELLLSLNTEIDKQIEGFFVSGGFTRFVNDIYQDLKRKDSVQVFTGSDAKKYFPADQSENYSEDNLALRIKTPNKTYILDIPKVKVRIKEEVFKTKLSA